VAAQRDPWQPVGVTPSGILLVARRHVDFARVSSAICRPGPTPA